jgi:phospholipid/cholesterol/gamma-HCH transport system substrate-binding protein
METRARYISVGLFVLAIIAAGFGFVYWLNNNGGALGVRTFYRIRFEESVGGLQVGAAVQFNGIRVGEVTSLQLDRDDPQRVTATIAVDQNTPLRADTKVGVTSQGLMGTPAISLSGGTSRSPLLAVSHGEPPVLKADPGATQDLTQSARQTLQHVDKILSDNSESIKSTIDNLKTFSGALARNSNRVDAIMAGLEHLAGGGPAEKPKAIYDLTVPSTFPTSSAAAPKGQLSIATPTAIVALQTQRMLARSSDGQISQLGDAQWSDALPNLIQEKVLQGFENAGIAAAAASTLGEQQFTANDQLLIDLRSFAITTNPKPVAEIAFSAKIVGQNGRIIGTKLIQATAPAAGMDTPQIAAAFNAAFGKAVSDLITWTAKSI